jgi:hypothetical protein
MEFPVADLTVETFTRALGRSARFGLSLYKNKIIGIDNIEFGRPVIPDDFILIYAKAEIRLGNYVYVENLAPATGPSRRQLDQPTFGYYPFANRGLHLPTTL